jgi:hypothetical protein
MKKILTSFVLLSCLGSVAAQPGDLDISANLDYLEDRLTTLAPDEGFELIFDWIDEAVSAYPITFLFLSAMLDSIYVGMVGTDSIPVTEWPVLVYNLDQARKEVFFRLPPLDLLGGVGAHFTGSIGPCTVAIVARSSTDVMFHPRDEFRVPMGQSVDLEIWGLESGDYEWEFDTFNAYYTDGSRAYFRNISLVQTEVRVTFTPDFGTEPCQAHLRVLTEGFAWED